MPAGRGFNGGLESDGVLHLLKLVIEQSGSDDLIDPRGVGVGGALASAPRGHAYASFLVGGKRLPTRPHLGPAAGRKAGKRAREPSPAL